MTKLLLLTLNICLLGIFGQLVDGATFSEKCDETKIVITIGADGSNSTVTTSDTCDTRLFLECKESRCRCKDAIHGVFTSKQVIISGTRTKRSPGKGGKSKGISKGKAAAGIAGAAVVAGGVGYIAGQNSQNYGGGSSFRVNSGSGGSSEPSRPKEKYHTVYSCFQRVDGDCVLDTSKVTLYTNTTTVNGSSVTVSSTVDYKDRPECIPAAECRAKRVPGPDTNIGECVCKDGYQRSKTDTCEKIPKQRSGGADRIAMSGSSLLMATIALLLKFL